jgi:hypothetical protein
MPVPAWVALTDAPGMLAPAESVTTPVILAVDTACPHEIAHVHTIKAISTRIFLAVAFIFASPKFLGE